jgi:hypothetical protein
MKKSKFIVLILLIVTSLNAQKVIDSSSKHRPIWLKETPKGEFFNYYSGISSSKNSLDEAKNLAISDVVSEIIMKNEINVELREAGGDWEMGVMYFRIEFTHQYGLLSDKYEKDPEFVWDIPKSSGKRFCIIPPVEAGNSLEKFEGDTGKYDWHAYQNDGLSKEDEKQARLNKDKNNKAWKWIEDLLTKLIDDRHEMLDK